MSTFVACITALGCITAAILAAFKAASLSYDGVLEAAFTVFAMILVSQVIVLVPMSIAYSLVLQGETYDRIVARYEEQERQAAADDP